jgi:hypothetical protein
MEDQEYDPFSDVELKNAFIELMKSMEDKISTACEQSSGKVGKNAKNTPQKNNVRSLSSCSRLYLGGENGGPAHEFIGEFISYVCCDFNVLFAGSELKGLWRSCVLWTINLARRNCCPFSWISLQMRIWPASMSGLLRSSSMNPGSVELNFQLTNRERAKSKYLELQIKVAEQDLESLENFNQSVHDSTINKDIAISFQNAPKMYQNILTTQQEMEQQGLGIELAY